MPSPLPALHGTTIIGVLQSSLSSMFGTSPRKGGFSTPDNWINHRQDVESLNRQQSQSDKLYLLLGFRVIPLFPFCSSFPISTSVHIGYRRRRHHLFILTLELTDLFFNLFHFLFLSMMFLFLYLTIPCHIIILSISFPIPNFSFLLLIWLLL